MLVPRLTSAQAGVSRPQPPLSHSHVPRGLSLRLAFRVTPSRSYGKNQSPDTERKWAAHSEGTNPYCVQLGTDTWQSPLRWRIHSSSKLHVSNTEDNISLVGDHSPVPLPFDPDALVPYGISEPTMSFHVDHYKALLEELNRQLDWDDALKRLTLEDLIKSAYNNGNPIPCFNLAAEVWNHQFFWTSLNPGDGGDRGVPANGELTELLDRDFGGLAGFKRQFKKVALSSFGSSWIWLSAKVETIVPEEWLRDLAAHNPYRLTIAKFTVEKTHNALNPIVLGRIPLVCLDMWEHAYIGDFKGNKEAYVDAFLNELISWDTVVARMENAKAFVNFREMPTPEGSLFREGYIDEYRLADTPITQEQAMRIATSRRQPNSQAKE